MSLSSCSVIVAGFSTLVASIPDFSRIPSASSKSKTSPFLELTRYTASGMLASPLLRTSTRPKAGLEVPPTNFPLTFLIEPSRIRSLNIVPRPISTQRPYLSRHCSFTRALRAAEEFPSPIPAVKASIVEEIISSAGIKPLGRACNLAIAKFCSTELG